MKTLRLRMKDGNLTLAHPMSLPAIGKWAQVYEISNIPDAVDSKDVLERFQQFVKQPFRASCCRYSWMEVIGGDHE